MTANAPVRIHGAIAPKISVSGQSLGISILTGDAAAPYVAAQRAYASSVRLTDDSEIEQPCGRFSQAAVRAIASGNPVTGEALELVRALWDGLPALTDEGNAESDSAMWNGLQAAAFLASRDLALVRKIRTIDYRGPTGGMRTLSIRHLASCVLHDLALRHCRCAAKKQRRPQDCDCLESAFFVMSDALRRGKLVELGVGSAKPLAVENCWQRQFQVASVKHFAEERAR